MALVMILKRVLFRKDNKCIKGQVIRGKDIKDIKSNNKILKKKIIMIYHIQFAKIFISMNLANIKTAKMN